MKNVRIYIALVLLIGISSCKKENSIETTNVKLLNKLEIQDIGIKHNEALDFVLEGLKNSDVTESDNLNDMDSFIKLRLSEFYSTIYTNPKVLKAAIDNSNLQGAKYISASNEYASFKSNLRNSSPIKEVIQENDKYLTKKQKGLLLKCDKAISGYTGGDITPILSKLEKIQELAEKQLSKEDAQMIIISAEIGINSVSYWDKNLDEWVIALQNNNSRLKGWFSWGELAGADVAGGVGAAVHAAVVNAFPGPGQAAYASAIVATAAAASAGDAVLQIWRRIF